MPLRSFRIHTAVPCRGLRDQHKLNPMSLRYANNRSQVLLIGDEVCARLLLRDRRPPQQSTLDPIVRSPRDSLPCFPRSVAEELLRGDVCIAWELKFGRHEREEVAKGIFSRSSDGGKEGIVHVSHRCIEVIEAAEDNEHIGFKMHDPL